MKQHQRVVAPAQPAERTNQPSYRRYDLFRRVADLTVGLAGMVFAAPLMVAVAVAIKLDSRGPVFYKQERVGRNSRRQQHPRRLFANVWLFDRRRQDVHGARFAMIKFRTMRVDAEAETGPVWAQEHDPRVTRVGRFLRRTRLDEIPQLWNVIKGEMTLIGPRPERPEFVRQFARLIDGYTDRHWVTPGITGLAQVRQGYDRDLDDVRSKVRHDLEYISRRSLLLDVSILWATAAVCFTGRGAR